MLENKNINIIKFLASILVIFNHTYFYFISYSKIIYKIEFVTSRIAVPLFIMCTGYLLTDKTKSFKYYLQKALKILSLLLLCSLIIYIRTFNTFHLNFFIELLKGPIIEPYWYLYMMFGFYFTIYFINKMIKNLSTQEIIYLILLSLFFPALLNLLNIEISSYWNITNFSYIIGYYLAGCLFKKNNFFKYKNYGILIFIISLFYGLITFVNNLQGEYYINNLLVIVMSISLFIFLLNVKTIKLGNSTISKYVLTVYLIHPMIQNKIYNLFFIKKIIEYKPILGIIIYQLFLITLCYFIAILYYHLKKQVIKIYL